MTQKTQDRRHEACATVGLAAAGWLVTEDHCSLQRDPMHRSTFWANHLDKVAALCPELDGKIKALLSAWQSEHFKLLVATACSGSECPILALRGFNEGLAVHLGSSLDGEAMELDFSHEPRA